MIPDVGEVAMLQRSAKLRLAVATALTIILHPHVGMPSLAIPAQAQTPVSPFRGKTFALIIGVSEYADGGARWLNYAHADALWFGTHLKQPPSQRAWDYFQVLVNGTATKEKIAAELRAVSLIAGPEASVYILISAPGFAVSNSKDEVSKKGYILGYRSTPELPRTLVRIPELRQFLQRCLARVFVFADVCRDVLPSGPGELVEHQSGNEINARLAEVVREESNNGKTALLASKGRQVSKEDPNLANGHGIFAYYLVEGLARTETFGALTEYVTPRVRDRAHTISPTSQDPVAVMGDPYLPLWRTSVTRSPKLNQFRLAFFQRPGAANATVSDADAWVAAREKIMEMSPEDLLRLVAKVKLSQDTFSHELNELSIALEERGNEILSRYLIGDRFPGDPLKPTSSDFEYAARFFAAALDLRPKPKENELQASPAHQLEALRLFSLGRSMIDGPGDHSVAATHLSKAISIDPQLAEPHNALGLLYLKQVNGNRRSLNEAADEFQKAISLAPNWAYPRHNLALTRIEMGQYNEAESAYREAILRTPYYPYLYCNLGLLLHRIHRLRDAARAYEDALIAFDHAIAELERRRQRLLAEGQNRESAYLQTRADLLKRYKAEAHNALGALRYSQGKRDEATRQYQAALSLNQDLLAARHNLAMIDLDRYLLGRATVTDLDSAIQLLKANVERPDPYLRSRQKLADAYIWKGLYKEASTEYAALVRAQNNNGEALTGWAKALAKQKLVDEALELTRSKGWQEMELASKGNPFARFTLYEALGEIHEVMNDTAQACRDYNNALAALGKSARESEAERTVKKKVRNCPR